jgi:hypothetical protein
MIKVNKEFIEKIEDNTDLSFELPIMQDMKAITLYISYLKGVEDSCKLSLRALFNENIYDIPCGVYYLEETKNFILNFELPFCEKLFLNIDFSSIEPDQCYGDLEIYTKKI